MKQATLWPIAIVGVLVVTVGANGYLLYRARADAIPMEADYYRKAIDWDSTMAQAVRNQALQWRVAATLGTDGRLLATVRDGTGQPIEDAAVTVAGFPVAQGDGDFAEPMAATSQGYQATIAVRTAGLYELRLAIARGRDRFTAVLRGRPGSAFVPNP